MKTHKAYSPPRLKQPQSLILELDYNRKLEEFSKTIDEFKELRINQKQEVIKNEEDETNILYYEDVELKEMLNYKEFLEKDFNIVNNFLRVEEEDNFLKTGSLKNKNNNINYEYGSDDDGIILNHLNHKLLLDEEFQPGLFTSFNFKDKIKSLVYNSLISNNSDFDFSTKQLNSNKKSFSNSSSNDNKEESNSKNGNMDMDGIILDMCLKDKNIESDNIIINFNEKINEEENKASSLLEDEKAEFEGFSKSEAIPEYENQIISFQNYYQIEHKEEYSNHPKVEEDIFDIKLFEYLANVSKIIQDRGLKNKIKLIIKLILYKDDKTKKYIFNNKEKNELLLYWKNSYIKELEEATYKEKNKILQQKLDNLDPNNKIIELTKKKKSEKRRAQTRKSSSMYKNIIGNSKMNKSSRGIEKIQFKSNQNTPFRKGS